MYCKYCINYTIDKYILSEVWNIIGYELHLFVSTTRTLLIVCVCIIETIIHDT